MTVQRVWLIVHSALLFIGFVLFIFLWNLRQVPDQDDISELAISLTVLEIMLAALAIILGLGAFFGFWMIRDAAISQARSEAREYMEKNAADLIDAASKTKSPTANQMTSDMRNPMLNESAYLAAAEEVTEDDGNDDRR